MRRSLRVCLILVLLLTGCGPIVQPSAEPATGSGETFMIALPRIIIDVSEDGQPSVFGVSLAQIGQLIGRPDLASLRVDPFYLNWARAANVQHVELRQTGSSLIFFVNSLPLPHVGWDDTALDNLGIVADTLEFEHSDLVRKLGPLVRRLGLDLVVRLPHDARVGEIPLGDPSQGVKVHSVPEGTAKSAVVNFEVSFDQQGRPGILGITQASLEALGIPAGGMTLDRDIITRLQTNNIQHIQVRSRPDGLYFYLNGEPLPHLVWDDDLLSNVAKLYAQTNPNSAINGMVQTMLPGLNETELAVLVHFPLAAGVTRLPARMN